MADKEVTIEMGYYNWNDRAQCLKRIGGVEHQVISFLMACWITRSAKQFLHKPTADTCITKTIHVIQRRPLAAFTNIV